MNLRGVGHLSRSPMSKRWYRAIRTPHLGTPLAISHTVTIPGRFNSASSIRPGFPILYLTEDPVTALFEVGAMLGSPVGVSSPSGGSRHWAIVTVDVKLTGVVDLTRNTARKLLRTSIQELTGDWMGYRLRWLAKSRSTSHWPSAPTQLLGEALFRQRGIEAFTTISARNPVRRNLVVFPSKLRKTSRITFTDDRGNIQELTP